MNLALREIDLPVRLIAERPMSDLELMQFCTATNPTSVQRTAPIACFELVLSRIWE